MRSAKRSDVEGREDGPSTVDNREQACQASLPPVRVLYVIDTLEVGGAERSLLQLCEHVDRARVEIIVCSIYPGDALRDDFERLGIRVIQLNLPGKYRFLRAIGRLRHVIRRVRPDLVHTTLFRADQIGRIAARLVGVPVMSSFVNIPYDRARTECNPHVKLWKLRALQICDRLTARLATSFHAVSATVRKINCRDLHIPLESVAVVHRGRDTEKKIVGDPNALRQELGVARDAPLILNVGRLVDQKGQRYLIEAMPRVLQHYPDAVLLIAGDGVLRDELVSLANSQHVAEQVRFLGHRHDTDVLLKSANCFAFPSLYEGMPGSVVEAMVAECPIVATDIAVVRELITDRETGLLAGVKESLPLAEGIIRMLSDRELSASVARQARDRVCREFDIRRIALQMEELYWQQGAQTHNGGAVNKAVNHLAIQEK